MFSKALSHEKVGSFFCNGKMGKKLSDIEDLKRLEEKKTTFCLHYAKFSPFYYYYYYKRDVFFCKY